MSLVRQVLRNLAWVRVPLTEIHAALPQQKHLVPTEWPIGCCQGEFVGQFLQECLDNVAPFHINRGCATAAPTATVAALESLQLRDDFSALWQQLVAIVAIGSACMVLLH